jgi:hypothetical protein
VVFVILSSTIHAVVAGRDRTLNDVDPLKYLTDVPSSPRIVNGHPNSDIDQLLPAYRKPHLQAVA